MFLTTLLSLQILCAVAADEAPTLKELIAQLKDADPGKRVAAAKGIGDMGAEAKDAIPALVAALKDASEKVRARATLR